MAEEEPTSPNAPLELRLRDLRPTDRPIVIVARVVSAERREVVRKQDGGRRPVLSGRLSDGTATVRFTWWDPPTEPIERGTVLRAGPVQVREFRGRPEVSFNWRTRVAPADASELPTLAPDTLPLRTVGELATDDEGFRLEIRIVRVGPKTVSVGEERRLLFEGVAGDRTGTIGFTAWSDFRLVEGASVRVVGGYVRGFRGRPQLTLDERSHVEAIEGGDLPEAAALSIGSTGSIAAVEAARGGEIVRIEGVIVAIAPPSGLVYRCPTCRRSVVNGLCRLHGAVQGTPDLRARLVVDDGTGAATVNAERSATEALWGRTLEQCLAQLRETPDPSLLEEQLFETVFGRRVRATGKASADDFGVTVYPDRVEELPAPELDPDPALLALLEESR